MAKILRSFFVTLPACITRSIVSRSASAMTSIFAPSSSCEAREVLPAIVSVTLIWFSFSNSSAISSKASVNDEAAIT